MNQSTQKNYLLNLQHITMGKIKNKIENSINNTMTNREININHLKKLAHLLSRNNLDITQYNDVSYNFFNSILTQINNTNNTEKDYNQAIIDYLFIHWNYQTSSFRQCIYYITSSIGSPAMDISTMFEFDLSTREQGIDRIYTNDRKSYNKLYIKLYIFNYVKSFVRSGFASFNDEHFKKNFDADFRNFFETKIDHLIYSITYKKYLKYLFYYLFQNQNIFDSVIRRLTEIKDIENKRIPFVKFALSLISFVIDKPDVRFNKNLKDYIDEKNFNFEFPSMNQEPGPILELDQFLTRIYKFLTGEELSIEKKLYLYFDVRICFKLDSSL